MKLDKRSIYLRELILLGLEGGQRGHIGSSMSLVEILRVLYDDVMFYSKKNPKLLNRDRLILSKGHGCLALYAMLVDKGFLRKKHLFDFCKSGSILGGHPDHNIPGVEAITGSLGHGLSIGIGIALALKIKKINSKVYVILGDGEMNEGSNWEAFMSASKHNLDNLIVLIDNNNLQTYGTPKEVAGLDKIKNKLLSFGFNVKEINGHSVNQIKSALIKKKQTKPIGIICKTLKGKGIDFAENKAEWHHKSSLSKKDISDLRLSLNKNI